MKGLSDRVRGHRLAPREERNGKHTCPLSRKHPPKCTCLFPETSGLFSLGGGHS